jgi:hypothetical protein
MRLARPLIVGLAAGVLSCSGSSAAPGGAAAPSSPSVGGPSPAPGAKQLYPTVAGGREWYLADDADPNTDAEFRPDQPSGITFVERGSPTVYHTDGVGPDAEIRLNVRSPAGKAWWRNVEMTAYYRFVGAIGTAGTPHTEMIVRGAFHTSETLPKAAVNDGVPPPPGTVTWPWWDRIAADAWINGSAIGTSYHGNVYSPPGVGSPASWAAMEKEVSHAGGYSGQRALVTTPNLLPPQGAWFGEKFIVRNSADGTRVRLELWLDAAADGTWVKLAEYMDQNGAGDDWTAYRLDGTDAAPYSIAPNQLITWAGPYAGFRADNVSLDFKALSVREIAPL